MRKWQQGALVPNICMDIKEETSESAYDSRLEPDVILEDSDDSNLSLSTSTNPSPKNYMFKDLEMQLEKSAFHKIRASFGSAPFSGAPFNANSQSVGASARDSGPLQQCPTCKKYFKRLSAHLLKHQEMTTDPDRPFTCDYCHKLFKNLSNLNVHMRSHTGIKPYICEVCKKGFTQSGNLVHHLRIHTGSKPFKCPVCDRAFSQSGNLGNHIRLHNQEKPFQCHICNRAFTQSSNLNSHLKNNHKEIQQIQTYLKSKQDEISKQNDALFNNSLAEITQKSP